MLKMEFNDIMVKTDVVGLELFLFVCRINSNLLYTFLLIDYRLAEIVSI